jgi:hypothetical protein
MAKSILWDDATIEHDRALVEKITRKIVPGPKGHREKCIDKIISTISTSDWQNKFTSRHFVFCMFYAQDINLIELEYALYSQALDALYYLITRKKKDNLADKFMYLFKEVYGWKPPYISAEVIRILRNNIMHTGAIFGIEAVTKEADKKALEDFCIKFAPDNVIVTEAQQLVTFAGTFCYLMEDIILRILGLNQEDLSFNLRPPAYLNYFKQ